MLEQREMPPSAKLVLRVLRELKIATVKRLEEETGLSRRTLMYAIKVLKEAGLIETQICLTDTRKRFYCIRLGSPGNVTWCGHSLVHSCFALDI
ncbi:MarR family transcriptional regulator [Thermogymnomonas acidicola]|uniref:MarR family transcriptional regulator n=1 Tax=Thermogymnomonas acidicola TaxID=399579 RepID=UPI001396B7DF|nr:helix-turn-helix domain-containing protein [Thermogymnomonas acidicola]